LKKRILWIIVSLSFILFPLHHISHATDLTLNNTQTQVCFSSNGGCTEAIISQIDKAKSEILVQAYSFTSAPIAKALTDAFKRGVKVEVILDKSQRKE
jgi:phosphatidylserine/phosphatidylglycerophosphate/cardiolipin synthase-like enzyme